MKCGYTNKELIVPLAQHSSIEKFFLDFSIYEVLVLPNFNFVQILSWIFLLLN